MSRPYSWYPLASSDPVPGDPTVVREGAAGYTATATAIADAAATLEEIVARQEAVSDAVDAVRDRMRGVAERVRTAHGRYEAAGRALAVYAVALDGAQSESLDALYAAQSAQHTLDIADESVRRWTLLVDDAEDAGEDTTSAQRSLSAAREERAGAEQAIAAVRLRLEEAVARRDRAAVRAEATFDDGTSDNLDDGWWEDWGADVAQVVSTWAGNISTGAGVLALFLGWVPFIGPALTVIAAAAGAAALIADFLLALNGEKDWSSFALGLAGLLTFRAGLLLSKATKAFDVSAKAASSQAAAQVSRSVVSRIGRALLREAPAETPRVAAATASGWRTTALGRLDATWEQVRSTRGMDRLLTLAGHGDLVARNNALRAQLWDAFPFHPRAFITLIGPTFRGTVLEGGATALYVGDVALALTSVARTALDQARPTSPAPTQPLGL